MNYLPFIKIYPQYPRFTHIRLLFFQADSPKIIIIFLFLLCVVSQPTNTFYRFGYRLCQIHRLKSVFPVVRTLVTSTE